MYVSSNVSLKTWQSWDDGTNLTQVDWLGVSTNAAGTGMQLLCVASTGILPVNLTKLRFIGLGRPDFSDNLNRKASLDI